jgi:hypothetical protein
MSPRGRKFGQADRGPRPITARYFAHALKEMETLSTLAEVLREIFIVIGMMTALLVVLLVIMARIGRTIR